MDSRRRIELQIRAVLVPLRIERRRRDAATMQAFRARARAILESLADDVRPYPDLEAQLEEARQELDFTISAKRDQRASE